MNSGDHYIGGRWVTGAGHAFASHNPVTGDVVWQGRDATLTEVGDAVTAAREALPRWAETSIEDRVARLEAFTNHLKVRKTWLADAISLETGKPAWEAATEVDAMIAKAPVSIEAYRERCAPVQRAVGDATGHTRYKPHGVAAVFGPFNFPGHVPNGHIVPALLAGNTVVFKPSERTPLVAERTVALWQEAALPAGVINLVQGARDTGVALVANQGIDALYFTGGTPAGLTLRRALADRPQVIAALEMGGNNPLVVHDTHDLDAAAYLTVQSAYLTAGQRCTCARRLIVPRGSQGDAFINRLVDWIARVRVGAPYDEPAPFMGPVIDDAAGRRVLDMQTAWQVRGGRSLVECRFVTDRPAMLSPGLIDVTAVRDRADEEVFGPLLQLIRVDDVDAAITEANNTSFGLVAGLFSDSRDLYEHFYKHVRTGLINWNRATTGAASALPFGGVGRSGNHRPAGYFSADYCSYPVASLEADTLKLPDKLLPGIGA